MPACFKAYMITFKGELRNLKKAIRYRFLLDFGLSSEGSIKGAKNRPSIKKRKKFMTFTNTMGTFFTGLSVVCFGERMIFLFSKIVFMFSFISSLCSPNYVYAAHTHTYKARQVSIARVSKSTQKVEAAEARFPNSCTRFGRKYLSCDCCDAIKTKSLLSLEKQFEIVIRVKIWS